MMEKPEEISVLLSLYKKETPAWFLRAMRSITSEQTRKPDEVVLVADGPLTEALERAVEETSEFLKQEKIAFRTVRLPENRQLGLALREGLLHCSGQLVARMDTDDIARPERLRLEETYLLEHPAIAAVGGEIGEFEEEGNIIRVKHMPTEPEKIRAYGKMRNPLNHMTVMFRKDAVLKAGNYEHFPLLEDYHLWSRMLAGGALFGNIPEVLVDARIGRGFAAKRGGFSYFKRYAELRRLQHQWGFLNSVAYVKSLAATFGMTMQPGWLRTIAYRLLRKG